MGLRIQIQKNLDFIFRVSLWISAQLFILSTEKM